MRGFHNVLLLDVRMVFLHPTLASRSQPHSGVMGLCSRPCVSKPIHIAQQNPSIYHVCSPAPQPAPRCEAPPTPDAGIAGKQARRCPSPVSRRSAWRTLRTPTIDTCASAAEALQICLPQVHFLTLSSLASKFICGSTTEHLHLFLVATFTTAHLRIIEVHL